MNPDTNRFEALTEATKDGVVPHQGKKELARRLKQLASAAKKTEEGGMSMTLLRPDGTPAPDHWIQYKVGEQVEVKGYLFRVAYMNETALILEPVGPIVVKP